MPVAGEGLRTNFGATMMKYLSRCSTLSQRTQGSVRDDGDLQQARGSASLFIVRVADADQESLRRWRTIGVDGERGRDQRDADNALASEAHGKLLDVGVAADLRECVR